MFYNRPRLWLRLAECCISAHVHALDSAEQATLRRVMQSADEQESDVYFELKTADARGTGGETLVFDAPSCRAGGREALPGQALWGWLGKHGLHEAYARAKARIL